MMLVGALLAAAAAQAPAPTQPEFTLTIAGPTYNANGHVSGGTASRVLQLNSPFTLYQYSGATLCLSSSATPEVLDEVGYGGQVAYGWQVRITPLRKQADKLVMRVEWQRMWNGGVAAAGDHHDREFTLGNGATVMLDYLSAAPGPSGCDAIGMGLQIGLSERRDDSAALSTLQTDLWLVHRLPDGTETSQHQTIRARVGDTTPYYFDDVSIPAQNGPVAVTVSGQLAPTVADGHLSASLIIARDYSRSGTIGAPAVGGGSATYAIEPKVGEVLSFDLPMRAASNPVAGHSLSLRVTTIQIR
jgi:hypothetical protein